MKTINSSAIAIAMLSSTVAMAATVIAPTPQNVTTTYTQDFNGELSRPVENDQNWVVFGSGKTHVGYGDYDSAVTHVQKPFSEVETDKALKVTNVANVGRGVSFEMDSNTELDDNDILKISFDAAMENKVSSKSNMQFSVKINGETNGRSVFKTYPGGWTSNSFGEKMSNNNYFIDDVSENEFTHYEVIFNNATRKVTYNSGTQSATSDFPDNLTAITSIDDISLRLEHNSDNASASAYYLDNMSFSVTSVTDEKVETFDTLQNKKGGGWNKNQTLPNAKYKFDGENVENTQDIETPSNRGNVLKFSGGSQNVSYVAMPLNYTMDDDDVFTFQFDYAASSMPVNNPACLAFRLEDYSLESKRDMGFTFKDPITSETVTTNNSAVFVINDGYLLMANQWGHYGTKLQAGKFYKITVVIDNSDDEIMVDGKPQRTLAVYVDGVLQSTKWIMTDNAGKESSKTINGVSLTFETVVTKYFDNLWASLADNDIKVDGDNVSYTYPVVYDNATPAIFVKAYYDANNRLISADASASATPSTERTVTTTLNKPEGTAKTKVFRWDSLDAIQNLSPAYDSSKVN